MGNRKTPFECSRVWGSRTIRGPASVAFALLLLMAGCFGQSSDADRHVMLLTEHWRWKQYWEGTTELGSLYRAGRAFQALIFWHTSEMPSGVGFCSTELAVCQYLLAETVYEMKLPPGDDLRSGFKRFLDSGLGLSAPSLYQLPPERENNYTSEPTKIVLPMLDPPKPIRDREVRPPAEIEALAKSLGCGVYEKTGCKIRLLIPFYSLSDPYIPVYRECPPCVGLKPAVFFMRFDEGRWWRRATDFTDDPITVDRMRRQIEKALMVEVKR
jgi:hypothetical protein